MTCVSRRAFTLFTLAALGSVLSACSTSSPSGAVGTSGQHEPTFVSVDVSSPPFVTVQNRTDKPLVDLGIAIKPVGGLVLFTGRLSRLEANEKRALSFSDFTSRDGTAFNLRFVRPQQIAITAADLQGQKFDTTVPWK